MQPFIAIGIAENKEQQKRQAFSFFGEINA
jgi:hypothetical protein